MARQDRAPREGGTRNSIYDDITSRIIAELEAGRLPWVQPWGTASAKAPLALPRNAATQSQYSGINILILWGAVVQQGYPTQAWLTFRQALALGGNFSKGERGTTVVYADRFTPEDEKRRARETGDAPGQIPFLKRFTVFNAAQCEGLPEEIAIAAPPPPPGMIELEVEALIRATGIDFRIGGDRAFYVPAVDFHPEETRVAAQFSLRTDPCDTFPLAAGSRGFWSDRHGIFEYYSALGIAGASVHSGDRAADKVVAHRSHWFETNG